MRKGSTKFKLSRGFQKGIEMYGSAAALARALGCNPVQIAQAKRLGILSLKHAYELSRLTNGTIPIDESLDITAIKKKNK